ncbi:hypothetical protein ACJ72_02277 [Emergomyces africanus]|uniref:Uncharacterized protein n=1 Tax=Emergomyces africanus TaxID=1955775 RepID=A0A1B7P2W8_9EURO|nr:hypothetical protein ACJ72_02277 [Emergomyces africanus]
MNQSSREPETQRPHLRKDTKASSEGGIGSDMDSSITDGLFYSTSAVTPSIISTISTAFVVFLDSRLTVCTPEVEGTIVGIQQIICDVILALVGG